MADPTPFRAGKPILAADLNDIASNALRREQLVGGPGILIKQVGRNLAISLGKRIPGVDHPERFRVQSINTDYLTCRTYDGTTTGSTDIYVAMPWDLRRTPFHGATVNGVTYTYSSNIQRSATDGTNTETHVITPPYFANCEIWAFRAVGGGTSVTVSSEPVIWQEMNVAGRAWAVKAS